MQFPLATKATILDSLRIMKEKGRINSDEFMEACRRFNIPYIPRDQNLSRSNIQVVS